jgi:hypothetical protein
MNLIAYFNRQRHEAEETLRLLDSTGGFRLKETKIEELQRERLQKEIAHYNRIIQELSVPDG